MNVHKYINLPDPEVIGESRIKMGWQAVKALVIIYTLFALMTLAMVVLNPAPVIGAELFQSAQTEAPTTAPTKPERLIFPAPETRPDHDPGFYVDQQVKIDATVLCDTFEQISALLEAREAGMEPFKHMLRLYASQKNEKGETACALFEQGDPLNYILLGTFKEGDIILRGTNEPSKAYAILTMVANDDMLKKEQPYEMGFILSSFPTYETRPVWLKDGKKGSGT